MDKIDDLYSSIRFISHDLNNGVYSLTSCLSLYALDFEQFRSVEKKANDLVKYCKKLSSMRIEMETKLKTNVAFDYLEKAKEMQKEIVTSCLIDVESMKDEYCNLKLGSIAPDSKEQFNSNYNLIKSILKYKEGYDPKPVTFKSIKDKFNEVFFSEGIEVVFRDDSKTPIYADSDNLVFALINLSKNSIRAIKESNMENHGRISIIADEYSTMHILKVNDNGPGFDDPKTMENLFTNTFTSKKDSANHGLGTKIVKKIVNDHKGNICAMSIPGLGTSVEIFIPKHNEYPDLTMLEKIEF